MLRTALWTALFGAMSLMGCARKLDSPARLSIQFPGSPQVVGSKTIISQSASTTPQWGQPDIASLDDVGCFAVFVGGGEPNMRSSYCKNSDQSKTFSFGLMKGFYSRGQTADLDVPSGPSREFRIVGLRLAAGSTCENFMGMQPTFANYSAPFVIGYTIRDLPPGAAISLNVQTAFSSTDQFKIDNCSGPAMPGTPSNGNFLPIGTGNDGNLTVTGTTVSLSSTASAGTGRLLVSTSRVKNIALANSTYGIYNVTTVNDWHTSPNIANGDEVLLYAVAANGTTACSNSSTQAHIFAGFKVEGFVDTATDVSLTIVTDGSGGTIFPMRIPDARWGNINAAQLSATAGAALDFCKIMAVRVPNFQNLTIQTGGTLDLGATLGDLTGTYDGGIIPLRVAGTLTVNGTGNIITAAASGYIGNSNENGQSSTGKKTGAFGRNNTGGSGATSVGGGGGGHGNAGATSVGAQLGGLDDGDDWGCNIQDTTRKCLFGKIFMGGAGGGSGGGAGGTGGGILVLSINALQFNNTSAAAGLTVDASGGNAAGAYQGGGGAGGGILFRSNSIVATGNTYTSVLTLQSKGGNKANNGGSGAGGRVHVDVAQICDWSTAGGSKIETVTTGGDANASLKGTSYVTGTGSQDPNCTGSFISTP